MSLAAEWRTVCVCWGEQGSGGGPGAADLWEQD